MTDDFPAPGGPDNPDPEGLPVSAKLSLLAAVGENLGQQPLGMLVLDWVLGLHLGDKTGEFFFVFFLIIILHIMHGHTISNKICKHNVYQKQSRHKIQRVGGRW